MNQSTRNSEIFAFPAGIRSMGIHISLAAKEWLLESVDDYHGNEVQYLAIFNALLASMQVGTGNDSDNYRLVDIYPGQAQISFNRMEQAWNMGRKRLRRILDDMQTLGLITVDSDRTATVVTFVCVYDWVTHDGLRHLNPLYRFRQCE